MRQLRITEVFKKKGKSGLTHLKGKTGTYIIYEQSRRGKFQEPVYVGWSDADLYNTIRRHFYPWDEERGVSYSDKVGKYRFWVKVYLTNKRDAYPLEANLIDELRPRDNQNRRYWGRGVSIQSVQEAIGEGTLKRVRGRLKQAQIAKKEETQPFYRYDEKGRISNKSAIKTQKIDEEEIPF